MSTFLSIFQTPHIESRDSTPSSAKAGFSSKIVVLRDPGTYKSKKSRHNLTSLLFLFALGFCFLYKFKPNSISAECKRYCALSGETQCRARSSPDQSKENINIKYFIREWESNPQLVATLYTPAP